MNLIAWLVYDSISSTLSCREGLTPLARLCGFPLKPTDPERVCVQVYRLKRNSLVTGVMVTVLS
jgi:hypothetical protein